MNITKELKEIINTYGIDFLLTPQFVNCLKDIGLSKEYPFYTTIFKDIITKYGDKLVETYKNEKPLELKKTLIQCRQKYLYEAVFDPQNTTTIINTLASALDVFLLEKESLNSLSNIDKTSSLLKELKTRFHITDTEIDDSQLVMFYIASIIDFSQYDFDKNTTKGFQIIKENLLSIYSGKEWADWLVECTPGACSMPQSNYSIYNWTLEDFESKYGKMEIILKGDKSTCRFVDSNGSIKNASIGEYASRYLPNLFDYRDKLCVNAYPSTIVNQQITHSYKVELINTSEYEGIEMLDSYLKERLPIYSELILYMSNQELGKRDTALNNMFSLLNDGFNLYPDILYHCNNNPKDIYEYVEPDWNGEHIKECPQNIKDFITFIINNQEINRREIIKEWTLVDFYKTYGKKMKRGFFKEKKNGNKYEALIFLNNHIDKYIVVRFDEKIGELSNKELNEQKEKLSVALMFNGIYKLIKTD